MYYEYDQNDQLVSTIKVEGVTKLIKTGGTYQCIRE